MLPLAGASYCLVVRPVLPSYMRINCLGLDPGGPEVVRLCQEGKLALLHEVKLLGPGTGGGVISAPPGG